MWSTHWHCNCCLVSCLYHGDFHMVSMKSSTIIVVKWAMKISEKRERERERNVKWKCESEWERGRRRWVKQKWYSQCLCGRKYIRVLVHEPPLDVSSTQITIIKREKMQTLKETENFVNIYYFFFNGVTEYSQILNFIQCESYVVVLWSGTTCLKV